MRFRFFFSVFSLFIGFFIGAFLVYSLVHPVPMETSFSWEDIFESDSSLGSFFDSVEAPEEISFLTGEKVFLQPHFVATVMVDNHPDARPQQSGLSQASIVYEAIAEGGITRYLAIVPLVDILPSNDQGTTVGPVRSARPYFVDWASEYNGFYVHAGGSDTALNDLFSNAAVYNIDGLEWEEVSFTSKDLFLPAEWRSISDFLFNRFSTLAGLTLFQPHNLFLDLVYLRFLGDSFAGTMDRPFAPQSSHFLFSDTLLAHDVQSVSSFSIDFSFPSYFVEYFYDATDGLYHRFLGQKEAQDLQGFIRPKNVIVLLTTAQQVDDYGRLEMDTRSGGKAWVFTQGSLFEGVWSYDAVQQKTRFFHADGVTEIALSPGQTWIEVVNHESSLRFSQTPLTE